MQISTSCVEKISLLSMCSAVRRRQSGCNAHSDFDGFHTNCCGFHTNCCHLCSWWQGTDRGGVDVGSSGDVVAEYIGMVRYQDEDLKVSE